MKPGLFIGSSVEGLKIAKAIELNLQHEFNITIWTNGVFNLSSTTLDDLLKQLEKSDFGIFVFSVDDKTIIRKTEYSIVRDNVLYELGLYTGKLGKSNTFIIRPSKVPKDFHLPTDLDGLYLGEYNVDRIDNLNAAVSPFCSRISQQVFNFSNNPLSGKWVFTWEVNNSENYPQVNSEEVNVFHYDEKIKFTYTINKNEKYKIEAIFKNSYITGTWKDTKGIGYDGTFQMKLNGRGDKFEGVWIGWNNAGKINSGSSSLKKK